MCSAVLEFVKLSVAYRKTRVKYFVDNGGVNSFKRQELKYLLATAAVISLMWLIVSKGKS